MPTIHEEITLDKYPTCIEAMSINDDGIGYVELHDFSRGNMSEAHRIATVTRVASVCYANPRSLGSISLYDRLATENKGLPSSSYEFVPVLINGMDVGRLLEMRELQAVPQPLNIIKYGEMIHHNRALYVLSNLRALIADVGDKADQFYNTDEECDIIAKHFKVFCTKIDLVTARQFML